MFITRYKPQLLNMKSPEKEREEVILRLTEAVGLLRNSFDARLIPPNGTNIVYAISGARDSRDVAAVKGGIGSKGGKVHLYGSCAFDVGGEISRIVLTTMKFDPLMRSAFIIKCKKEILKIVEEMFIECRTIDHVKRPPNSSNMDWGIASCCKDGVPEIIYDVGITPKESLIRVIGQDPVEVVNNIIILSNRIQ